jgi:hypothetical protein
MQPKHSLTVAAGILALAALGVPAHAVPLRTAVPSASASPIEKAAAYCWWRNGVRHCGYGYGPRYRTHGFPQHYRTGSRYWWEEMDREQRGGRR